MNTIYANLALAGLIACLFSCHSKLALSHATGSNLPLNTGSTKNGSMNIESMNTGSPNNGSRNDLLGINSRESLQKPPFDEWFLKNYRNYRVDSALADQLKPKLDGKRFLIFMGTWCGDSRREVPRMYRLLDYCGVNPADIELVMVSKEDSTYKQSPGHEEKGLNIFRVPDLLVFGKAGGNDFRERKEFGRIVESPVISLEKDLLAICTGQNYTPRYPGAALLIGAFSEEQKGEWEKMLPALADRIRSLVHSPSELISYAHVLRVEGETERANMVLKLNALIFPAGK